MDAPQSARDASLSPGAPDPFEITRTLSDLSDGGEEAFERLVTLVYDDLKAIAHRRLEDERTGHTLRTTALVHEAYLRLVRTSEVDWHGRAHFLAVASRVMRHVLVDHARARNTEKRGGGSVRLTLTEGDGAVEEPVLEVVALEEALSRLARRSPRLERVVECRFFGGMSVRETAAALDVSPRTVKRDWRKARAYLYRALAPAGEDDSE